MIGRALDRFVDLVFRLPMTDGLVTEDDLKGMEERGLLIRARLGKAQDELDKVLNRLNEVNDRACRFKDKMFEQGTELRFGRGQVNRLRMEVLSLATELGEAKAELALGPSWLCPCQIPDNEADRCEQCMGLRSHASDCSNTGCGYVRGGAKVGPVLKSRCLNSRRTVVGDWFQCRREMGHGSGRCSFETPDSMQAYPEVEPKKADPFDRAYADTVVTTSGSGSCVCNEKEVTNRCRACVYVGQHSPNCYRCGA